ncbi:MAG: hypothetical protein M9932_04190 [Xanthobacteraceae bacterium]|nr:hypothetical protein [Xanthobacteraceae bacterium]
MRATWYVLEDGRVVDPAEVGPDAAGTLRHSDGVAVAMRGQTPSSRSVDLDNVRGKDLKPEDNKPAYKTREAKAK